MISFFKDILNAEFSSYSNIKPGLVIEVRKLSSHLNYLYFSLIATGHTSKLKRDDLDFFNIVNCIVL